jgi:hypothetical protein
LSKRLPLKRDRARRLPFPPDHFDREKVAP